MSPADIEGPVRVQLSRAKGWKMPPNTAKVDRTTVYGNPWTVRGAREAGYQGSDTALADYAVALFREWLGGNEQSLTRMLKDSDFLRGRLLGRLPTLRGKNLACWCKPGAPCHAEVLLELANGPALNASGADGGGTKENPHPEREATTQGDAT